MRRLFPAALQEDRSIYIREATIDSITAAVDERAPETDEVVAIFLGEAHRPDLDQLVAALNERDIAFFGGFFPGIIHGAHVSASGALVVSLPVLSPPVLIRGLDRPGLALPDFPAFLTRSPPQKATALMFMDGLSAHISHFLSEVFNKLGSAVNYLGGGAGSLSLAQEPCIFTREGVFCDAAVVCFLPLASRIGVRHGWSHFDGPFIATNTDGTTIRELNWRPAFEVYARAIEADCGETLSANDFFSLAKRYPFGIGTEANEYIVRDPIRVQGTDIVCVGEVPEHSVLSILRGERANLIAAAGCAARDCMDAGQAPVRGTMVVDCVSRMLYLGDVFEEELAVISATVATADGSADPFGVLSLGEIAGEGDVFLEFFNKTVVVGRIYE
ncbi:MAG TPA: hypothetical protein ENN85_06910 [Methanoculleus sp.]|nr:hypothetical protein [Methanoculleus sp.]